MMNFDTYSNNGHTSMQFVQNCTISLASASGSTALRSSSHYTTIGVGRATVDSSTLLYGERAHATKLYGGFFISEFEGFCTFFYYKALRGTLPNCTVGFFLSPEFFVLLPIIIDYHTARGKPLWLWQLFSSRKPILFNNIIMHLLHFCIHCGLAHSCSTLHKSRDGFCPLFY